MKVPNAVADPKPGKRGAPRAAARPAAFLKRFLPVPAAVAIAIGLALHFGGDPALAQWVWAAGTGLVLAVLLLEIARSLSRGEFGLDLIAAMAMAGALALGENLAGSVVALMYAGGQGLEDYASGRARREMSALLSRVPRSAVRYRGDRLEEVKIGEIVAGDRLLVRRGEVLPVDGYIDGRAATLDQSALTGESLPIRLEPGASAMSGSTNAGDTFDLLASGTAGESTYAGIVRLVEAAQAAKAPMMRLADRYALGFLAVTVLAAAAAWFFTRDPERALAVLVVATPCPLILAVPVAIISGISRCARKGVLVKGGGALERLARIDTVLMDKTGTVTEGRPRLLETRAGEGRDPGELLRLAASLDQGSHHTIARALVEAARERALDLATPGDVREEPGAGISGTVDGKRIDLGGFDYVRGRSADTSAAEAVSAWIRREGTVAAVIAIDGEVAGAFLLGDRVRPEAGTVLRSLRATGVRRLLLVTGDRTDLAEGVAEFLGVDEVVAEARPEDKTRIVERERAGGPVLMVGDGVNDAPALAAADVGVAMGARGTAASSESADVVILLDRLDRLVSAMRIARRSRAIALESVYAGIGMSLMAMVAAGLGYLKPVEGALLQEAIDVAVILNALRALGQPLSNLARSPGLASHELGRLEREHAVLADILEEIRSVADAVGNLPAAECARRLDRLDALLRARLLPHERHDDEEVYPRLQRTGAGNALAGMSRTHMEIKRYVHTLTYLRGLFDRQGPDEGERREIVRLLDGLEAILRLHFSQEEEIYRALEGE